MKLPERSSRFEWNFNTIVLVGGLGVSLITNVAIATATYVDTKRDIADVQDKVAAETQARKDRGIVTDGRFVDLNKAVAEITPLSYQVTQAIQMAAENKEANKATNARFDRFGELLNGKIDTLLDTVNSVKSDVRVLSSKIEDKAQRTRFAMPEMKP